MTSWRSYKPWFWAATIYNAAWGTLIGLRPQLLLDWMGMTSAQQTAAGPLPQILSACIGMFVGVYAIGYACVALDPPRFWPFALLGLLGKIFGPIGAIFSIATGHIPPTGLWVNVFNDFIWWPAFFGLLLTVWREYRAGRIKL
jgi:small multidrug resistance pump